MTNKLLYSVRETFSDFLDGKTFHIPPYQRGYKWKPKDVGRLLDDIDSFSPDSELGTFYCVQNITLVESAEDKNVYNVVDGQQRLTTTTVILSYLEEYDLIKDKLSYDVRQETASFIHRFLYQKSTLADYSSWEEFLEQNTDCDFQDIYYLFQAYHTVKQWFEKTACDKASMKDKLLNHVKFIVNLPRNIDEQELFENLNGKRVPLDGADLVRALLITRIAKQEAGEMKDSVKADVLMNERRVRTGMLLDEINQWWSDTDRQDYFRQFAKEAKSSNDETNRFDTKNYPINLLYQLYTLIHTNDKEKPIVSVASFEQRCKEGGRLLTDLTDLQRTLACWYDDKELYHLILFVGIYCDKKTFRYLYDLWQRTSRRAFTLELKSYIKKEISAIEDLLPKKKEDGKQDEQQATTDTAKQDEQQATTDAATQEKKENWYNGNLTQVCVLLDIIHLLNTKSTQRLPPRYFKRCKEDFEHIFPQTPIGDKITNPKKQTDILHAYLKIINEERAAAQKPQLTINDADIDWEDDNWKNQTKEKINKALSEVLNVNSLGNMCLLDESVNRGYGNDFFLEKRIDIMRKSQTGCYIRPHVYDAFNKAFLEREKDHIDTEGMGRWSKSDITARRAYIVKTINDFLNTKS